MIVRFASHLPPVFCVEIKLNDMVLLTPRSWLVLARLGSTVKIKHLEIGELFPYRASDKHYVLGSHELESLGQI